MVKCGYARMDRVEKPRLLFALCSRFIRFGGFFMKFHGRNAHPNRPGGLSYLAAAQAHEADAQQN